MVQCRIKTVTISGGDIRHGRARARETKADTGDPAFLGWHQGWRAAPAALRDACANVYFPPRPFCPSCASRKVSIFKASGKGKLYSYVINHRPAAPGFTPPYAIAVVELDEGPRMMSNIIDCPQTPEALELDMRLEVAFEALDDKITLPLFRPAKG
ncbi:putative OB-fold protein [Bradyrhizobium sp. USDA 4510]